MIDHKCVPYKRKPLYLILTLPMILTYILIAVYLWGISKAAVFGYLFLFAAVAFFMSYVCVYWECPYVGKFAPCVGGFCLPSSRLALLFKNAKRSEKRYNWFLNLAYLSFFGIILFPIYFLYLKSIFWVLIYLAVVVIYWIVFSFFVCPVCATRRICPGGKMAVQMREKLGIKDQE